MHGLVVLRRARRTVTGYQLCEPPVSNFHSCLLELPAQSGKLDLVVAPLG
jgi:hypothetical protein